MQYQVLGPVVASSEGAAPGLGGPKQRLVLAMLLRDVGQVVPDDRLVDGVWPEDPPPGARHTIQTYISELRRIVEDEIKREANGYRLVVERDAVDAHRFETLVEAARARLADAASGAAALFRDALALWHGEPYADLADAAVLRDEIQRLKQTRLHAVEDRVQADLVAGRHADVVIELEALTRENPYRERLHGLLMLALYRAGRQAEALRAYDRARMVLAEDLGIDPAPDLQQLQQRVLQQDPSLLPSGLTEEAGESLEVVRGFELRECVARRGNLTIWRAYQASAACEVAVTVIGPEEANTHAFVRGFESHAQALARIEHPHLVPLLDHWRDPRGAYLVTPWLRGGSLRRALTHGPWSLPATLRLLEQVAGALGAVHRAGLVHRAVGTANVLLDGEGGALLLPQASSSDARAETSAPPELRHGLPASPLSDIYAAGILAIEALVGHAPPGNPVAALRRTRVPIPPGLEDVLERATTADPAARYERVEDLLRDLRRVAGADVVGVRDDEEPGTAVRNPYKGLRAFRESDGVDFYGRETLVEQIVNTVASHRLVAVVGPSGSGKSSVVRAGLIPALRTNAIPGSHDWILTEMFPGAYPFEELVSALTRVAVEPADGLLSELLADDRGMLRVIKRILPPEGELVLIIDQFEELFSLTTDPEIRRRFLQALVVVASEDRASTRIVLTLRADFFDRPLEHHALGALVREGLVPVTMPAPDDLARAISQPARSVGIEFEPNLIPAIVRDVADQPGALPLLQHALTEAFEHRDDGILTAAAYAATGGVMGALGRRAEELYGSLTPEEQRVTAQVFLRLVAVEPRSDDARRRVRRTELATLQVDPSAIAAVLRAFGTHRLLSFDRDPVTRGPTVEVAHEALFHEWARLRSWIDSRREDLLLHRRLAAGFVEWRDAGCSDDFLLSGGRLEQFERWETSTDLTLTDEERAYLSAGRLAEDMRAARRRRRRRGVVAVSITAVIIAGTLAAIALEQRGRARAGERVAQARALAAASRNQLAADHDLALLLAIHAVEVTGQEPLREAVEALHNATISHRATATLDAGGLHMFFLPGGRLFTAGPPQDQPVVWNLDTGEPIMRLPAPDGGETWDVAVSPDGRLAAASYFDAPTVVWDLRTGSTLARLEPPLPSQAGQSFSPDGRLLAVINGKPPPGEAVSVSVWDVGREVERYRLEEVGDPRHTAFSPNGRVLAISDWQAAIVRLFDVRTGQLVRVVGDPTDARGVAAVAFDPSGKQLAMNVLTPVEVQVRSVASGELLHVLPLGSTAAAGRLCYSAEGGILAANSPDETTRVWDARTGTEVLRLPGTAQTDGIACSADGSRVANGTPDGVVRIWNVTPEGASEVLTIGTERPWSVAWSPDGKRLISTHHDATIQSRDATTGQLLATGNGLPPFPPWWIRMSDDGRYLGLNANPYGDIDPAQAPNEIPVNARLVLYDGRTMQPIRDLARGGWPVGFDAAADLFVASGADDAAILDVGDGALVGELPSQLPGDFPAEITSGGFLPDGRHVVVLAGRSVWVFDHTSSEVVASMCISQNGFRAALSPDGTLLATASFAGMVDVWDLGHVMTLDQDTACPASEAVATDARVSSFEANAVMGLHFSPDNDRLSTAGFDGRVRVFNVRSGAPVLTLEHEGVSGGARFSPDGRHLAVAFDDSNGAMHSLRVYTLDTEELLAIARAKLTRDLTESECRRFLQRDTCS